MILLLESLHRDAEEWLAGAGPVLRAATPDQLPSDLAQVRAIVTRGRGRIDADLIHRCPALRVIARAGAGLDNLDTQVARDAGVQVLFAPGLNTNTVAEHTLALMLDLARQVSRSAQGVAQGKWEERAHYDGWELGGRTLGILGYGNIGRRVAALGEAFGMRILVGARAGAQASDGQELQRVPLTDLLPQVDVLSLHLPLTPQTQEILGPDEFRKLKPGALLVNTARGGLLHGGALRESLAQGRIGGFAADVLDVEPPDPRDPLLASERVVLTPHVASLTSGAYRDLCLFTAQNVVRCLQGEPPEPSSIYPG